MLMPLVYSFNTMAVYALASCHDILTGFPHLGALETSFMN